jgi:hypothetical protein
MAPSVAATGVCPMIRDIHDAILALSNPYARTDPRGDAWAAGVIAAANEARRLADETTEWQWQCAECHRSVPPMGMCETCGVFGIYRLDTAPDPAELLWAEQEFNRIGDPDVGGPGLDEVPF